MDFCSSVGVLCSTISALWALLLAEVLGQPGRPLRSLGYPLFTVVRGRVILVSWSVRRPLGPGGPLLSATQDPAGNQKRVSRAHRRHHRDSDQDPEARVASSAALLLLAAHELAVVRALATPASGCTTASPSSVILHGFASAGGPSA
jgi:hypothetical protein